MTAQALKKIAVIQAGLTGEKVDAFVSEVKVHSGQDVRWSYENGLPTIFCQRGGDTARAENSVRMLESFLRPTKVYLANE